MATTFFLRTRRKSGYAPVCVRVQSSVLKINIRQSTNLRVPIQKWNLARTSLAFRDFLNTLEGRRIFSKLEDIRLTIDERIVSGRGVTAAEVRQIVHDVVYRECLSSTRHGMTLDSYMKMYIEQTETGVRKTQKGVNFSKGTVKSIRLVGKLMTEFQQKAGRVYDFDDVDYEFRAKFLDFLYNHKGYNVNTAAKCLNTLITVMAASEAEGCHSNRKCLGPQCRARRRDVDAVYLTREELEAMMRADLSHLPPVHEVARDIFMVGVFTAQRVSDYARIGPSNMRVNEDGSMVICLRQQKTGVSVSIPVRDELKAILCKYDYNLPLMSERTINRCIKEVGKVAGVCSPVTVETTVGGVLRLEPHPKYELIQTHTARRTGATLMYLAGMDVFNICLVTGHSSVSMLKKYIKADDITRARTIRRDPAFGRW